MSKLEKQKHQDDIEDDELCVVCYMNMGFCDANSTGLMMMKLRAGYWEEGYYYIKSRKNPKDEYTCSVPTHFKYVDGQLTYIHDENPPEIW